MKRISETFSLGAVRPNEVSINISLPQDYQKGDLPVFDGSETHVTVTRGDNSTLTIHRKSRCGCPTRNVSFDFGSRGYTLISEGLKSFKKEVLDYLISQSINIYGHRNGPETELELVFPDTEKSWPSFRFEGRHVRLLTNIEKEQKSKDHSGEIFKATGVRSYKVLEKEGPNNSLIQTYKVIAH